MAVTWELRAVQVREKVLLALRYELSQGAELVGESPEAGPSKQAAGPNRMAVRLGQQMLLQSLE